MSGNHFAGILTNSRTELRICMVFVFTENRSGYNTGLS